jgi:AcrR family transcriptional regulator
MARTYRLKQRASDQEQTRQRIVEATIALHQERGDSGTTISAIAELAGVGRTTVYRHFPDERTLLTACTSHYFAENPPPHPAAWGAIADPVTRLVTALEEVYAFYRRTEAMLARAEEDAPTNPVLADLLAPFIVLQVAMRDTLAAGWLPDGEDDPALVAAVGLALGFGTWRTLTREQGLDDPQAVDLMVRLVTGTAQPAGDRELVAAGPS